MNIERSKTTDMSRLPFTLFIFVFCVGMSGYFLYMIISGRSHYGMPLHVMIASFCIFTSSAIGSGWSMYKHKQKQSASSVKENEETAEPEIV